MNIYVSGLSFGIKEADLNELFAGYGEVTSCKVITDKFTGKSRGFGFVEMSNDEEGQKAIDELNGAEYDGRTISVSVARPQTERKPSYGGGGNRNNSGYGNNNGGYGRRY